MTFTKFYPKTGNSYVTRENTTWTPAVDVVEEKDKYVVELDVPGLEKDDFKLTVNDDVLFVAGERKTKAAEETEFYSYYERVNGKFERSLRLPKDVDSGKIAAAYKNGVLKLEITKKEEAKPQTITITD